MRKKIVTNPINALQIYQIIQRYKMDDITNKNMPVR